jgi:class 3 adenylate cyclase
MLKLLRSRHADPGRNQDATDTRAPQQDGLPDRDNRTFVCAVLFLDIVHYAKKPVTEQLKIKEQFTARISDAIRDIPVNDRIVLDTGEGVAVNFLDNPEDALFVALQLFRAFASVPEGEPRIEARIGLNFGPVRLLRDGNGQPNIIGDGISVAERVTSFAATGQVLVSRSYYEVVTRSCEDYAPLFAYQGSRTDKHVREHEIYEVAGARTQVLDVATRRHSDRPAVRSSPIDPVQTATNTGASHRGRWLAHRTLAYSVAMLSVAALLAAIVFPTGEVANHTVPKTAKPAAAPPTEPPQPPAPPPIVAEAPAVLPAAPEPAPAVQKDNTSRKPAHPAAKAKVRKPASRDAGAVALRAEPKTAPEASGPPKTAAAEERAPVSSAGSPKTPPAPTALVMFAISPWGEVLVDGKAVGVSPPLSELELAPGHYRVEIRNSGFKPYLETFDLEPNQTIRIKYKFKER